MHPPTGPEAIVIFGFPIYWYGILIVLGMLAGAWVASKEVERRRALAEADLEAAKSQQDEAGIRRAEARIKYWDPDHVWGGLIFALILGVIGARLYHVLTPPPSMGITPADYFRDPIRLINIRAGGLGLPGAIAGGLLGVLVYTWRYHLNFLDWADLGALAMPLGVAIGRWGNFFNQELYGKPTNLPWAVEIDNPVEPYRSQGIHTFHPAFLYESLLSLIVFGILYYITTHYRDRLRRGDILAGFLVLYPLGRFFIEFIKLDAPIAGFSIGGWMPTIAQLVLLVTAIGAALFLYLRHRSPVEEALEPEAAEEASVELSQAEAQAETSEASSVVSRSQEADEGEPSSAPGGA